MKQVLLPLVAALSAALAAPLAQAQAPTYTIIDLGALPGDVSQAFAISPNGNTIVGRSFMNVATPTSWNAAGQLTAMPELAGRANAVALGVNNAGVAVGTASTTISGTAPLPVMWQNGTATQLAMPGNFTVGRATAINNNGVAVGSVGGGTSQVAAVYGSSGSTLVPQLSDGSGWMVSAQGINDSGLVIGAGFDLNNQARNSALLYNLNTGTLTDLGGVAGKNGAIPFAISNGGQVVGASMQNQGDAVPFIWTAATGMVAIPLLAGTGYGSASGVNSSGWVVGSDGAQYSNPWLYANGSLYSIASLLPANSGWDFVANTAASATAISDNGTIVGTAYHDGVAHAYEMVLTSAVPEPGSYALLLAGLGVVGGVARRRGAGRG